MPVTLRLDGATLDLDGLAAAGLRFTQFYNTGRCCPTRASSCDPWSRGNEKR